MATLPDEPSGVQDLHWRYHGAKLVSVQNVHIKDRIIPPTKARVDAMASSMAAHGQLQPILVIEYLHSAWKVIAGATRLLAARELGWKEINASIISADGDIECQLIEIAENLDRHDLSEAERTQLKKKNRKYHDAHREQIIARKRKHYESNRARIIALAREYRSTHRLIS